MAACCFSTAGWGTAGQATTPPTSRWQHMPGLGPTSLRETPAPGLQCFEVDVLREPGLPPDALGTGMLCAPT